MIVRHVALRSFGATRELSAQIVHEDAPREKVLLWFRWPAELGDPEVPGDVFLAALRIPAMTLHEDLTIEAPISRPLDVVWQDLTPMLLRWFPRLADTAVHAERTGQFTPPPDSRGVGCFFSGGVDSFYSLIDNDECITHLICIHGLEIEPDNRSLWTLAASNVEAVAGRWNKTFVPLSTNLDQVGHRGTQQRLERRGAPWADYANRVYASSFLVAIGLVLRAAVREVIVPATWTYEQLQPAGSHPLMEPRFSTPDMAVRLHGCEADRMGKLRAIAERAPESFASLRVCVDKSTTTLNCGHCVKCVRTLMAMRACGLSELASTFPAPLDLAAVKRNRSLSHLAFMPGILAAARTVSDTELAETVEILMGRRLHLPRELDRLREACRSLRETSPLQAAWHAKAWLRRRGAGRART